MSTSDALKAFGLKAPVTSDELKRLYYKLAAANHPDKGGSTAAMQRINVAYEVLKGSGSYGGAPSAAANAARSEFQERVARYQRIVKDYVEQRVDLTRFTRHFERIFDIPFTVDVSGRHSTSPFDLNYAYRVEFSDANRRIVLSLQVYIDFTTAARTVQMGGGAQGDWFTQQIRTEILYNRKSVKLAQSKYRVESTDKTLLDPELLFPAAKLEKQTAASQGRKLSKRDILLTFQKELNAKLDREWAYIPVGNFTVALFRTTIQRMSAWSVNGVYEKYKRVAQTRSVGSYYEDEATLDFLTDEFRKWQSNPPESAAKLANLLDSMWARYRSVDGPGYREK